MNYSDEICKAIDLMAQDNSDSGQSILDQVIIQVKKDLKTETPEIKHYQAWAMCLEIMEEFEQSLLKYEKILELDPDHVDTLNRMVSICIDNMNNPDTASVILKERLLKIEPDNLDYQGTLLDMEKLIQIRKERKEKLSQDNESIENSTPPPTVH